MRIKNVTLNPKQVKAGPDDGLKEGEIFAYPSTFTRTPDSYGDVVAKGAFLDDIQAWKDSGNVLPGLYGHRMDDPDYFIAGTLDEGEDEHGWWVKGEFDLDNAKARQVYRLVKGRRISQLSFAYDVLEEGPIELEGGVKANELRKLKRYEWSIVPVGANQDTSVVAVKAITDDMAAGLKAGRVLSSRNELALREARDSIDSVLASLDDQDGKGAPAPKNDQEKASGDAEAKSQASDEEPETAKSSASDEEPKSSPSADDLATQLLTNAVYAAGKGS